MPLPLDEWLQIMVQAENLVKIRRNGLVYLDSTKFDLACMLTERVNIDFMEWLDRYFDYDHYR